MFAGITQFDCPTATQGEFDHGGFEIVGFDNHVLYVQYS